MSPTGPRRLFLMRHAEAGEAPAGGRDYDRPLTPAGRTMAAQVGKQLAMLEHPPRQILCSAACRTTETAEIAAAELSLAAPECIESLYLAPMPLILRCITNFTSDALESVLVVGHNPGIGDCIRRLSGASYSVPPATLLGIFVDGDWVQLEAPTTDGIRKFGFMKFGRWETPPPDSSQAPRPL